MWSYYKASKCRSPKWGPQIHGCPLWTRLWFMIQIFDKDNIVKVIFSLFFFFFFWNLFVIHILLILFDIKLKIKMKLISYNRIESEELAEPLAWKWNTLLYLYLKLTHTETQINFLLYNQLVIFVCEVKQRR